MPGTLSIVALHLLAIGATATQSPSDEAGKGESGLQYARRYDEATALRRAYKLSRQGGGHKQRLEEYRDTLGSIAPGTYDHDTKIAKVFARLEYLKKKPYPSPSIAAMHFGNEPDAAAVKEKIYAHNHKKLESRTRRWFPYEHDERASKLSNRLQKFKQTAINKGMLDRVQPALDEMQDKADWHRGESDKKVEDKQREEQRQLEQKQVDEAQHKASWVGKYGHLTPEQHRQREDESYDKGRELRDIMSEKYGHYDEKSPEWAEYERSAREEAWHGKAAYDSSFASST